MIRALVLLAIAGSCVAEPIRLHPENPRYFEFRGKPAFLLTSAEHYGAVINRAFDYRKYLDTLAADGLNYTRIFAGQYREVPGTFSIARNTLAPAEADFVAPYKQVGGKYDLTQWNPAFFDRLKDFVAEAGKRGIVVEVTLFCTFYQDRLWDLSPMNAKNNVQGIGKVGREEPLTLKDPALLKVQEAFVRKIVTELKDFDNVIYEICNEPYFAGVSPEWQRRISSIIVDTEKGLKTRHLIAQNIANHVADIRDPDPNVDIFNFHYARPPVAVARNWNLRKPIGYDESGFDGAHDSVYRIQAWDFLLAGGSLFNNLDYSFAVGYEDGTFEYPPSQPGGGSVQYRKQLATLRRFLTSFDFIRMTPADNLIVSGVLREASARALSQQDNAFAIYLHHGKVLRGYRPQYAVGTNEERTALGLNLPAGSWRVRWWNPKTGKIDKEETIEHGGGVATLASPPYREDIALELRK